MLVTIRCMTTRANPTPGYRSPYAPPAPPRTPLDDIPADRRLPADHPLAQLVAKATTPEGLNDIEWTALAHREFRHFATAISRLRRAYNQHRQETRANGEPTDPQHTANLRAATLADLSRAIPASHIGTDALLADSLRQLLAKPRRPYTGRREFNNEYERQFGHSPYATPIDE